MPKNKNKEKEMAAVKNTDAKTKQLQACQMKHCKSLLETSQKQNMAITNKIVALFHQFIKKKITKEEYTEKANALRKEMLETKEMLEFIKCNIQNCEKDAKALFASMPPAYSVLCKAGMKSNCEREKDLEKLVKKFSSSHAPLTVEEYKAIVHVMAKSY